MKAKSVFLIVGSLILCGSVNSQTPQGFNFQAIARDVSGNPIVSTPLSVETGILSDTVLNVSVWKETHNVSTNQFGLFTLIVGQGTRSGGSATLFSQINWTAGPLYIRTKVLYQSVWRDMGAAKLWSVPYAMVADKSSALIGNPITVNGGEVYILNNFGVGNEKPGNVKLSVMGDNIDGTEALFEVKRKDGQTMFAVYNDGVEINVPAVPKKGVKGGFAIGGFDNTKGIIHNYLVVHPDSIRFYFDDTPQAKGTKGGFAIGGFDVAKTQGKEYLLVTDDSTRINVNQLAKGPKGGFAIGGFDVAKGPVSNFLDLTPKNYFIGHQAGFNTNTGIYNAFIGYRAGYSNTSGSYNTVIGYEAGTASDASYNTFFGYKAGLNNTTGTYNLFMGFQAGAINTTGSNNVFLGLMSGMGNTTGYSNVFIGNAAGLRNGIGISNTFIGNYAGYWNTGGNYNIFMGEQSGYSNTSGSYNLFSGYQSGYTNTTGYNNVFQGYLTGFANTIGYSNVFMGNSAGKSNTDGFSNTFIGNSAGFSNTTGFFNIFIGEQAGLSNTTASRNVFLGQYAGRYNTTGQANVFIGQQTGEANTTGSFNLFAGRAAGNFNTTGLMNSFLGINSGNSNTTGNENVMVGAESGKGSGTGSYNTYLGVGAGHVNTNGNSNIILGYYSGFSLTSGSDNIFIGKYAGGGETTTSGKLYIENSNAGNTAALIYGDFTSDYLRLNANVDIRNYLNFPNGNAVLYVTGAEALWYNGTYFSWGFGGTYNYFAKKVTIGNTANPAYMLYVQGSAYSTGSWATSDLKFKKNIAKIESPLYKVLNLNGVTYNWRTDEYLDRGFSEGRHYGVIAQEVEKILPEVVNTDEKGEKAVSYIELVPILIEAVKEQQSIIVARDERIAELEKRIIAIESALAAGIGKQ